MKKIIIITWLGKSNYGTSLQSYALCQKIVKMGYYVEFLQPFNIPFTMVSRIFYILDILGIYQLLRKLRYIKMLKLRKVFRFQNEKYNIKNVFTNGQYQKLLATTDVFIAGSDQIWNAWYAFNPFFFLNFAGTCKRISYASSIGANTIPDIHKQSIKKYLSKFSHISVREKNAVFALRELLKHDNIREVLDPTFLLSSEDWEAIASEAKIEFQLPEKFLLCYLIGNNNCYKRQLLDVKKNYCIDHVIIIPAAENPYFSVDNSMIYSAAGPKEFVHLIQKASLVCTDSFHATAMCINSSVNFVEFLRFADSDIESQNSRIYNLLDHYGLRSRLYSEGSLTWLENVNYVVCQQLLEKDRLESVAYLSASIEN